jgi:hypothetical protein
MLAEYNFKKNIQIELWEWSSILVDSTIGPDKNAVSYAINRPNTCEITWENATYRRNVPGNVSMPHIC